MRMRQDWPLPILLSQNPFPQTALSEPSRWFVRGFRLGKLPCSTTFRAWSNKNETGISPSHSSFSYFALKKALSEPLRGFVRVMRLENCTLGYGPIRIKQEYPLPVFLFHKLHIGKNALSRRGGHNT